MFCYIYVAVSCTKQTKYEELVIKAGKEKMEKKQLQM
jgi:hypothetical protein